LAKIMTFLLGLFVSQTASQAAAANIQTVHDFAFKTIDGEALPLSQYKGKAVLVVNTASFCGFTPQYEGLQALQDKYKDQGLIVLGVPSNDFGKQEPGSSTEIKDFCDINYSITFPLTEKEVVSGDGAHPFYKWAKAELGTLAAPKWNFHKYLITPEGKLADWFSTMTKPGSAKVIKAIEAVLP